jgi:hypothetical protein
MKEKKENKMIETDGTRAEYYLLKGAPCPDLVTAKDFLRFHITLS